MNASFKKEIMMVSFAQSTAQLIVMMTKHIAQDKETKWDVSSLTNVYNEQ